MRWRVSLAGQFLLYQLGIVLLVVLAVAAVSLAQSDAAFRREQGAILRSAAENLAANDTVRQGMAASTVWYDSLAAAAETARSVSGSSLVVLTDARGVLLTGLNKGRPAALGESNALTGRAWLGVVTDGPRSLVAHAPVLDPATLRILGLVVASKTYPSWPELLAEAIPDLLTYLLLGSALGVAGSLLLARRVKNQTLGLEPDEITGLVEHREAMLHGIKEGLIGLDGAGRVTLANDEAIRLLGLPDNVAGLPLRALGLGGELTELLIGGPSPGGGSIGGGSSGGGSSGWGEEPDHVVVHDSRVLVLNRMPVVIRGRAVGSVTTLRDRTELTSLERELDTSRNVTDTLRAQAHEFTNRLHTISGLVQLGQYDEAVNFIIQAGQTQEALNHEVQSRIADPALAALVIAKASVASEQHVTLLVAEETDLPSPLNDVLAADLVTVTGNLIDNAIDAAHAGGWVKVLIRQEEGSVLVSVTDSGEGVSEALAGKVFTSGFTTKSTDGHRGLGLALISQVCAARGGSISVDGSAFTARLPLPPAPPQPREPALPRKAKVLEQ